MRDLATAMILTATLLVGCVSVPVQEMSEARLSIAAARDAGGDPQVLEGAQKELDAARVLLEAGDYADARRRALEAKKIARQAQGDSLGGNRQ